jgi:SAM-dependent methyltransferase
VSANTIAYYNATALKYDHLHGGNKDPEHIRALEKIWPISNKLSVGSVLDVGCGSGRSLQWLDRQDPSLELFGVDPSQRLLDIARQAVPRAMLQQGSGESLPLPDNSVDVAVATGIMHHVDNPSLVIAEMFRVARKAVMISDHNNFAFGGLAARRIRMALYACGLLKFATYLKQGFKRQGYSEDDGWWYPYSLFNNHVDIARFADDLYLIPTRSPNTDKIGNLIFSQTHFAVFAIKRSN